MNFAKNKKTGEIISADGEVMKGEYDRGVFLHILPKLWLPYAEIDVTKNTIHLMSVKIDEIGFDSENEGINFKASRPYPNFNYVVFGNGKNKLGFYIYPTLPLPEKITIQFNYLINADIYIDGLWGYLEITHEQHLEFNQPELGRACYSTENCLSTFISHAEYKSTFEENYKNNVKRYGHPVAEDGSSFIDLWFLETLESINPLPQRFVQSSCFEEISLFRDKKQLTTLTKLNVTHENNAFVTAPITLLLEAISLSIENLNYDCLAQFHPSIQLLCNWWNKNNNVPDVLRRAKCCRIFIRINNDDEYHDIDLEIPPFKMGDYSDENKHCSVTVGHHFIILYMLGQEACTEENGITKTYLVNGVNYEEIGVPLNEYALGMDTLKGLQSIPDYFPEIYDYYVNQYHGESNYV